MAAVALLSSAVAAFWLLDPNPPDSPAPLQVVQRLDRPVNVAPFDPVQLAATAQRRWTALDIEREWTRLGSHGSEIYPGEREDRSAADAERARTLSAALERLLGEQRAARARFAAEHAQPGAPAAREASRELLDRLRSLGYVR